MAPFLRRSSVIAAALALAACSSDSSSSPPPPQLSITSQVPPPNAVATRLPEVAVVFAEDLDPASVGTLSLEVRTPIGVVPGTPDLLGPRTVRWTASAPAPFDTELTAILHSGVRSVSGAMVTADVAWSFHTTSTQLREDTLPIGAADASTPCAAGMAPAWQTFTVATGLEAWSIADLPATGLVPQWGYAPIPFSVSQPRLATDRTGRVAAAGIADLGSQSSLQQHLRLARQEDNQWVEFGVPLPAGSPFELRWLRGGGNGGFVAAVRNQQTTLSTVFLGPRATTPDLVPIADAVAEPNVRAVAIDPDTAVVCTATQAGGLANYRRLDCRVNPPLVVRSWSQPFGELEVDGDGSLLALYPSGPAMRFERQRADGTVADASTVATNPVPAALAPGRWRIQTGAGSAAAIGVDGGTLVSFRLDGSRTATTPRFLALPQDTIDTGAFAVACLPNGTLLLAARLRTAATQPGSLQIYLQPADQDWQVFLSVQELAQNAIGLPSIACDADGRWLVAATRSFHPELFVLRAKEQGLIPSPR